MMIQNAKRDNAQWAWVPQGDTCAFCITLASNGWQKASSAVLRGNHAEHIHQNCDCTFAIAFKEKDKKQYDYIYDPQKYKDIYYGADGGSPEKRINYIRRQIFQRDKDAINAQKRSVYANHKYAETSIRYHDQYSRQSDKFVKRSGITESELHNVQDTDKAVIEYLQKEFPGYKPAPLSGTEGSISKLSIIPNNSFSFRIERSIYNAALPAGESNVDIGNDILANDIHERVHDLINNLAMKRAGIIDESNFGLIQQQLFISEREIILRDVFVYCFDDESYDEIRDIISKEFRSRAADAGELIPEAFVSKIGLGNSKLADKIYEYMKAECRKQ